MTIYTVVRETNKVSLAIESFTDSDKASELFRELMLKEIVMQLGKANAFAKRTRQLLLRKDTDVDFLLSELYRFHFNTTFRIDSKELAQST